MSSMAARFMEASSRIAVSGQPPVSTPILRGAFTLSKLVLFVIGSPAQFRNRFRSLSNVNRSGSQNASKNAAAAAEKTE